MRTDGTARPSGPPTDTSARQLAFEQLKVTETRLSHEFSLAGQRMTWLVSSQAFLFGAWVSLVPKLRELVGPDAVVLSTVIPVIGFVTAIAGGLATSAAVRMVDILVAERARYDAIAGVLELSALRPSAWTRVAGHIPTGVLPVLFAVAWTAVFVNHLLRDTRFAGTPVLLGAAVFLSSWFVFWFVWTVNAHLRARKVAREIRARRTGTAATASEPS